MVVPVNVFLCHNCQGPFRRRREAYSFGICPVCRERSSVRKHIEKGARARKRLEAAERAQANLREKLAAGKVKLCEKK